MFEFESFCPATQIFARWGDFGQSPQLKTVHSWYLADENVDPMPSSLSLTSKSAAIGEANMTSWNLVKNRNFSVETYDCRTHRSFETSINSLSWFYEEKWILFWSWRLNSLTIPHLSWDFKKQFTEGNEVRTWVTNAAIHISVKLFHSVAMVCALSPCYKDSPKTGDMRPDVVLELVLRATRALASTRQRRRSCVHTFQKDITDQI